MSFVFPVIIHLVALTKVVTSGVVGRMVERQPESSGGPGTAYPTLADTEGGLRSYSRSIFTIYGVVESIYG